MAVDQQAIVFPGTQFRVLSALYDPEDVFDIPAKTVAYGGVWDLDDLGYTKGGATVQVNRTIQDEYFDQDIDPAMQIVTQRDIRFRTVLGEATLSHMLTAFGFGDLDHTDSTDVLHGDDTLFINGLMPPITDITVGLEAKMRDGMPMRFIQYRSNAVANVSLAFMKNTTVTVPFEARAMNDTTVTDGQVLKIQRVLPLVPAP